jgi:hypothetical protein
MVSRRAVKPGLPDDFKTHWIQTKKSRLPLGYRDEEE